MTFQSNPLNSDLIAIKNESAIARSIRNIVFTKPGEKFFNASFGSRITESLFENIDDVNATLIEDEIRESIDLNEPRVELNSVKAFPNYDLNNFDVIIAYDVVGTEIPTQELQFVLQSSR
jgi:phage baseplate assembly protein W|tara:strand:+ start:307 stop:666 length:360 start_codon:yes stop_codon:yes gene_type:complete